MSEDQLTDAVTTLVGLTWPMPESAIAPALTALGWSGIEPGPGEDHDVTTDFSIAQPEATFGVMDGVVLDISVRVSDIARDDYPDRTAYLRDVFAHIGAQVAAVIGAPSRRVPGERSRLLWDLPSGAQLKVSRVTASVWLHMASPYYADLQREG